jgi:hypothetical protein
VCGQHYAPAAFTPGKEPVPIVQEAGWAPEPVWIGAENLAPPGFDPRTFQPVASRYTDYAIPARTVLILPSIIMVPITLTATLTKNNHVVRGPVTGIS